MAVPRVFISSTCYDLKYVRENLKSFVRSLGYEPVLSEEGNVLYDPKLNVVDACLAEVPACQFFVLVIGGRFGGRYKGTEKSITNVEYEEAVRSSIPVFALVEKGVQEQLAVYQTNKSNKGIDAAKIEYPAVDSPRIFDFVEQVQAQTVNNAIVPFADFGEMRDYLKVQWAAMMHRYLTSDNETRRVGSLLQSVTEATQRIEFLTRTLVHTVSDPTTRATVEAYDIILRHEVIRDITCWQMQPTPQDVVRYQTLDLFCGGELKAEGEDDGSLSVSHGGPPYRASPAKIEADRADYKALRSELLALLVKRGIPEAEFVSDRR